MKKIVFFLCLAVLIGGLLDSCGGLRPSSMNTINDIEIAQRRNDQQTKKTKDSLARADEKTDVDTRKQLFKTITGGDRNAAANNLVLGLVINRYDARQVKFLVKSGKITVASYIIDGSKPPLPKKLPLGNYKVEQWEYTVKGLFLETSWDITVTNEPLESYNGIDYHFVISN